MDLGNTLLFIVANQSGAGKGVASAIAQAAFGAPQAFISSSAVVEPRLDVQLGLPAGTVAAARRVDHEAYRTELVALANAMAAADEPPGLLCVEAGYQIIDGLRRAGEVELCQAAARARGLRPFVLFIEGFREVAVPDNTEADGLRALADAIVPNWPDIRTRENEAAFELRLRQAFTQAVA